jgi:hypothetical protein
MTRRRAAAAALSGPSEEEFQAQVVEFARLLGWRVASFRRVRVQDRGGAVHYETPVGADGAGWPDLCAVRRERLIFIELKIGKNRTTLEQERWLLLLEAAGVEAHVWRPEQWSEIEAALRGDG